jgi:hypothetical protein
MTTKSGKEAKVVPNPAINPINSTPKGLLDDKFDGLAWTLMMGVKIKATVIKA